jgi:hypothetical protein
VEQGLAALGVEVAWIARHRAVYRPGFNDTSVLLAYFAAQQQQAAAAAAAAAQ